MDQGILFTEKQKFKQWWLWVLLLGLNAFFIYEIFKKISLSQTIDSKQINLSGLIIVLIFMLLLNLLFYIFRLETQVTTSGIYVRLYPLNTKYKFYAWHTLSKSYIRQYSPLKEYGGWGIRYGIQGMAYSVSGNKGLQLELKNNKKVLIGTNKSDELNEVLLKIDQIKP